MKIKLTPLLLGFVTCGFLSFAQDKNNPVENGETKPVVAPPVVEVAVPPPAPETAPPPPVAPLAATDVAAAVAFAPSATAPSNTNDSVPLIVIEDVPLTDAIRNLARQSNLNFQFDPKIASSNQPNVSIRFENVTPGEALTAVLDNYNLIITKDPRSKIARITIKDPKAEDPLVSRIIQLRYSDPTNLVFLVKSTLSARSSVVADGRTSQMIVNTTDKEMDNVVALIAKLDSPTKQVLIEARLLETSKSPSTIKGVDWSGTVAAQNVSFGNNGTPSVAGSPQVVTPSGVVIPAVAPALGGLLSNPKILVDTAKGFNPATAFLNADGVSAVLSFLNKDAETEVVAMPRAVTLDNQTAQLSVTRAFPVFQITPGSANSPAGASVTYTNLGTILSVTPRIAADKNISLHVAPEVSNIDSVDRQTLNGTVNTANIYAVRRIETHVMIPSGNTLVMGGMINDSVSKNYTKVPVLGDIPGLGAMFRSQGKSRIKSNLIIFITPTIVEDGDFHLTSTGSDFLKTRMVEKVEAQQTDFDSAKPHDWTKPSNN